jgi:hypothetical protein
VSWLWAFLVGLLSVGTQVSIFYIRFGRWNTDTSLTDYLLLFLAGALGGGILVFFLNRQTSTVQRRAVLIAFLLASPVALLMMIMGGLLGWIGVLIYPQIPWALFTWIGSLVGKLVAKG